MSNRLAKLYRTLRELRRRHVYRMAGGYVVVVWAVLQVADILLPAFLAPDWVMSALVITAILGAPVVLILTWIYDLTPEGIKRTPASAEVSEQGWSWNWRWIDYLIIAVLSTMLIMTFMRDDFGQLNSPLDARATSIAVMPFTDLSPEGDHRHFTDGLSEALMDGLANIPGLQVATRTSSFAFRDTQHSAQEVANALEVDTLLEGSLRKSGNQLRISVRLIDGASGRRIWHESFTADDQDIFAVQDSIARAVANSFQIRHLGDLASVLAPTRSHEAYDEYLQGRGHLRQTGTIEHLNEALAHFERALAIDAEFMLASAGLCRGHWLKYLTTHESEHAQAAFDSCERAENQNANHVETLVALGELHRGTGEIQRSFEKLEQALAIAPNDEQVHAALGETYRASGQLERAEESFRTAIRLDPAYWRNYWSLGRVVAEIGRLDDAAGYVLRAIELEPDNATAYSTLGGIYFYQSEFLKAAEAFRNSIGSHPTPQAYANAGTQYFYGGDYARARAMFEQAVALSPADFRFHGFLAESILLENDEGLANARPSFERAIELARETLAINPEDQLTRAAVANYLATLGLDNDARAELQRLESESAPDMRVFHLMGLARLALCEAERALEHFRAATAHGYPQHMLESDPRTRSLYRQISESSEIKTT